ncbi:MAG: sigma-70 family RNA polymerase sigma factor [Bacteroidota bacterium]
MQNLNKNLFQHNGQSGFYTGLYENLRDRLLREGYKLCVDRQLVEDTVQEIFLYFLNKQEDFDHVINIESYLLITLKRRLIKVLSRNKDRVSLEAVLGSLSESPHEIELIKKEVKLSEANRLQSALGKLPKGESQAIRKRFLDGFSYEEIANQNNCTVRTVYNQIYSGIKKMRGLLSKK